MAEDLIVIESRRIAENVNIVLYAPPDWEGQQGSETVRRAFEQMILALATINAKNRLYGDAWREQGWMGNLARIMSKTARLKAMLWKDQPLSDAAEDPFTDTVQDLLNLCVFMILNRWDGNRWGHGDGMSR